MAGKIAQELQRAFVLDDFEAMKSLVKQGVDVNSVDAKDDSSILHRAVIENEKSTVDFLLENHADSNKLDRRKMTPLHYAALYKHVDVARASIKAGALVDAQDQGGSTPLAYAASDRREGYLEMVKLLVASGANTDPKMEDGKSLLEFYGISLEDIWRDRSLAMNALIKELVDSEIPTAVGRGQCLGFAKNVRAGHHDELEITGNAFNIKFTREGVRVESLWDEGMAPRQIDLDEFIRVLSTWPAT